MPLFKEITEKEVTAQPKLLQEYIEDSSTGNDMESQCPGKVPILISGV